MHEWVNGGTQLGLVAEIAGRLGEIKSYADGASVVVVVSSKAAVGEHFKHLMVVAHHERGEFFDPLLPRDLRQMVQEQSPDATTLEFIKHREGYLCRPRIDASQVAPYSDKAFRALRLHRRSQADMIDEVQFRQPTQVRLLERALVAEKTIVDRTFAQTTKVLDEQRLVLGTDSSNQ